ncbi:MAG: hypothetical protein KJ955_01415 [Nanoarchaeota archaeon]|nr:hypothetical protein [Nanoarchaeota archaeon]
MVMDNKGYIKTLEAVIAIVIILIFTFAVTPKPVPSYRLPSSVENAQDYILEEIGVDDGLRTLIMNADTDNPEAAESVAAYTAINTVVDSNLPTGYAYIVGICAESVCVSELPPEAADRSIYTAEAMIASDGTAETPRIVRIWMWQV